MFPGAFVDRGAIAPGKRADLVVFADLNDIRPALVFSGGRLVAQDNEPVGDWREPTIDETAVRNTVNVDWNTIGESRLCNLSTAYHASLRVPRKNVCLNTHSFSRQILVGVYLTKWCSIMYPEARCSDLNGWRLIGCYCMLRSLGVRAGRIIPRHEHEDSKDGEPNNHGRRDDEAVCLRLISAVLMEIHEDWQTNRICQAFETNGSLRSQS